VHGISYNEYPLAQSINRCTDYKVFTQVLGMLYVGPGGPVCLSLRGNILMILGFFYSIHGIAV
jgi:hypothetical protein